MLTCYSHRCLAKGLQISLGFLSATHRAAAKLSNSPTMELTKFAVMQRQAADRVLVPSDSLLSQSAFLKTLKDTDKVKVVMSREICHKSVGKPSNNKRAMVENLFIQFVREHRSPTGRTPDEKGLFHGAEYHLDSRYRALCKQRATGRIQKYENYEILAEAFIAALPSHVRALTGKAKPPSAGHDHLP